MERQCWSERDLSISDEKYGMTGGTGDRKENRNLPICEDEEKKRRMWRRMKRKRRMEEEKQIFFDFHSKIDGFTMCF